MRLLKSRPTIPSSMSSSQAARSPRDSRLLAALRRAHDAPQSVGRSAFLGPAELGSSLASLQDVRPPDRVSDAEAPRPAAWRGDGGLRTAPRSGGGPRPARAHAPGDDTALRANPPGRA